MFSPDGRWIAYGADEAVALFMDVYVRPFPGPGARTRVSTEGAVYPQWSATAPELLFVDVNGAFMFAPYDVGGGAFRMDKPRVWSPAPILGAGLVGFHNSPFALHPDGKRLAVVHAEGRADVRDKVVLVFNFFDYLPKIAPAK